MLARRLYDLGHAALSLWLNASGAPAEIAARARTSARVLHDVHLHCTDGQDDLVSQRIEDAVDADGRLPSQCVKAKSTLGVLAHPLNLGAGGLGPGIGGSCLRPAGCDGLPGLPGCRYGPMP
ncbi:MAG TPA: hypothetical protein VFW50_00175, partial [Streptosporangiaceae bacterium]|nr:hypothetical protein [Streptosporangiaceae bacterium]